MSFYRERFGYKPGDLPITEKLSDSVLSIPIYPDLNKNEIDFVVRTINDFFEVKNNG